MITTLCILWLIGAAIVWLVAMAILGPSAGTKLVVSLPINLVRLVLLAMSARTIFTKGWGDIFKPAADWWTEWREKRAKRKRDEAVLLPWRRKR